MTTIHTKQKRKLIICKALKKNFTLKALKHKDTLFNNGVFLLKAQITHKKAQHYRRLEVPVSLHS